MTYTKIGKSVNKNHASVLHACKYFDYWTKQDEGLLNIYTKIKEEFRKYLGYEKADKKLEYNLEMLLDNYLILKKQYEELKNKYHSLDLLD
jgi:chromosomal replication initiation ATPase DnaA